MQIIKSTVREILKDNTKVWLFGSRVDDNKRGGDIDLLIETNTPLIDNRWRIEARIDFALQRALGEQKIDIILHTVEDKTQPIHHIAKQTGIKL
ncbi:MAG: nucleotidyltransferase domain-containing protein [Candidatus Parabeggiatoa sp. nov. 3]|nr:MAG: nucleotidyltransferase domain-containing protein [Gammaproteobacteria bacterium]